MGRLQTVDVNAANGELAHHFAAIKRVIGKVPNVYATLGANSPELLGQMLQLNGMLQTKGKLTRRELEAINLAVSEDSGCDYCVAAHTLAGKAAGFSIDETRELRQGRLSTDARIDALVKFTLKVVDGRGTLPLGLLDELRAQGFTDPQVVEAIGAMSAILFTNMLNRVNDTAIDFPSPD